ncbi:GGDEF domain-containing protein [Polymorphospora sp. NPDC051019]|uniref:GGDEF domain-containing protein n=1 Tax=Polymorphospora sp. NPDC051019 TaxID=3155725 RepID=UPI003421A083
MTPLGRHSITAAALALAATGGYLTARRTLTAQITAARHDATHDSLTGAYNRAGLTAAAPDLIAAAGRARRPVVVALVDLVGFKAVNDRHGHDAGDHILTTVAGRLAGIAGPAGIAARLGGDEFALVTTGPAARLADAERWLAGWLPHIHGRLTTPVTWHHGDPLAVGATIGATLATTDQPLSAWLTAADRAMYAARDQRTTTATAAPTIPPAVRRREMARPTSRLATAYPRAA